MDFWVSLIAWLHVLLFVYWLGGDLGVFYSSRFRNNPQYDLGTRTLLAKITGDIDMAPRTTMVLMVPIGFTLVSVRGLWTIPDVWLIAFWAFGLVWLALVWWLHLAKDVEKKKPWARFDLGLRWVLMIAFAAIAVYSFIFGAPITENWTALKVLIFAGTILCGIMIRISAKPYIQAFGIIRASGSTPELEATLSKSAANARQWVKAIWVLIALAAFIGIWKPGF